MIFWRLVPAHREAAALDGVGASLRGGRWNSKVLLAVYLSLDPATTVLETLTTYSRATAPGHGYKLLKIEYTGSRIVSDIGTLPRGWDRRDSAVSARRFGKTFLREAKAGALLVPSVYLKVATNVVLNPLHPDARKTKFISSDPFDFDPRWPRVR